MYDGHVQSLGALLYTAQCSTNISQTCKGFELVRPTGTKCPAVP